jgi:inhibitor of KinA sporulation pathway (predicted exonuclease)
MGMADALRALGLSLDGEHHRALDDARNIAAIARTILFPRDIAP